MNIYIGTFHNVVGAAIGPAGMTILDRYGIEKVLPFNPVGYVSITGEFGEFPEEPHGEQTIEGVSPNDIVEITIDIDNVSSDFHTRWLRLYDTRGVAYSWKLFCDGVPFTAQQAA